LIAVSAGFRRIMELGGRVAPTDAAVFLTGESGVGKEMIAQLIHRRSPRAGHPLVAVNCAAMPENLFESEMFGHVRGAFTGAERTKPGLLEVAAGGTMLLDEITELAKPLQAKLLRVLEDGIIRRVGSERPDATVNVRFIAATNRDPTEAVAAGQLREDLFYRLHVVPIHVPALRERPEDIPPLADHFLSVAWPRHRGPDEPQPWLGEAALQALCAHSWPGNVRELQNVIERAAVLAEPGAAIGAEDLTVPAGDSLTSESDRSVFPVVPDLPRGAGGHGRALPTRVPRAAPGPGGPQHLRSRARRRRRPVYPLSVDGAAWPRAAPRRRRLGRRF
jgi:transcriptional regulator with PAS, ATPase and Fis domain